MRYNVHTYDVWGNKKDGFEVNDVYPSRAEVELPSDATDRQIVQALKDAGVIRKGYPASSFDIDGELDYSLYVTHAPSSYPLCELRAQRPLVQQEDKPNWSSVSTDTGEDAERWDGLS